VINAGGVLHGSGLELLGWTRAQLEERLAGIGDTLLRVYSTADEERISTDAAARRLAAATLDRARPISAGCLEPGPD